MKNESKVIDIEGVKVMVCGNDIKGELPESDIQALKNFIQYRKDRKAKHNKHDANNRHSTTR